VRPGHLECVRKLRPHCQSSSSRGSNLPCRQGGRQRRLHSASSSKQALCRRLGGASACCKARRTVHVRRHRPSARARTAFEAPLRTPRTHPSAPYLCSIHHCFRGSASNAQCSVLSTIQWVDPSLSETAQQYSRPVGRAVGRTSASSCNSVFVHAVIMDGAAPARVAREFRRSRWLRSRSCRRSTRT